MDINKVKALYALLTGGIGGILKYINRTVNMQLLGKIKDKETALKYIKDVQAIYALAGRFSTTTETNSPRARRRPPTRFSPPLRNLRRPLRTSASTTRKLTP